MASGKRCAWTGEAAPYGARGRLIRRGWRARQGGWEPRGTMVADRSAGFAHGSEGDARAGKAARSDVAQSVQSAGEESAAGRVYGGMSHGERPRDMHSATSTLWIGETPPLYAVGGGRAERRWCPEDTSSMVSLADACAARSCPFGAATGWKSRRPRLRFRGGWAGAREAARGLAAESRRCRSRGETPGGVSCCRSGMPFIGGQPELGVVPVRAILSETVELSTGRGTRYGSRAAAWSLGRRREAGAGPTGEPDCRRRDAVLAGQRDDFAAPRGTGGRKGHWAAARRCRQLFIPCSDSARYGGQRRHREPTRRGTWSGYS